MLAASQITDRAKRYRAHSPELRPEPPKQCGFCGSKQNVVPHHISGKEADLDPQNLMWACKSCNTRLGFLYRNHGIGTRTMQYNPSRGTKREQMERYAAAIKVMRGDFEGDVSAAVQTIRSTPREIRSAYTSRTWPVRRQLYGESGRANPAVSAEQYRLAQAVLSGTARETHMSKEAAREIVDRTPAHLRSEFMEKNPASYRGKSVAALEQMLIYAQARAYDDDWLVRDRGRRDVAAIEHALTNARKREARKGNQGLVTSALGYSLVDRALPVVGRTADRATRTILGKRKNGKRRNSQRAAEGTYESFHGRPPEVDTVIETEMHEHSVLPGIGELCWLVIRYETDDDEIQDITLRKFDGALLAMNEQRNHLPQLYIEGGDQRVDLKQFEIGPPLHEHETLGRMVCVAYFTTKDHLGEDGGEAEYVHVIEMPVDMEEFKEWGLHEMARGAGLTNTQYWDELEEETEGAQGPDVIYDTRNKLMLLSGGTYTLPDEGIEN